ncbi:MAG: competence/damage-inducible protein A [Eubacteriales bacterium]|nr:competence/damage-inducible protein A [Eubacteriales bacterium]MDD3881067.1 competence/damage-inducible protein A [Eubacteriales bacterium]MDD4511864.1 competence/damage-inducible protein A [Eubacteriales bacterium]
MVCECVFVGTELLMGQILNSNAQFIARRLTEIGVTAHYQVVVGDNPERAREAILTALSRSDVVITTGGLGPTQDDLTKEITAEALGLEMELVPEALETLKVAFVRLGCPMAVNNERQAYFARGARLLPNPNGTAEGSIIEKDGKAVINLPGPPREMKPMFTDYVKPYLLKRAGLCLKSVFLRLYGIGESDAEMRVMDLMKSENPTIAPYCGLGEVEFRLTASGKTEAEAQKTLEPMLENVRERFKEYIYSEDVDAFGSMEIAAVRALTESGMTVATAESITGGMIAEKLTSVAGASKVVLGGLITYCDEEKTALLGVKRETLEQFTAISAECAREMAYGARERTGADIAVSVTGVAGPGDFNGIPAGTVYLALADKRGIRVSPLHFTGDRERIRTLTALRALNEIRKSAAKG